MLGLVIGGVAASTLVSAISGYYGAKAQARAYEKLAEATEAQRREFKKAYDESFGPGSYNDQIQKLGQTAGQQYYDLLNDTEAWDRYLTGDKAYVAPQDFSFTERDFTDDPSYKVRLKEGLDALDQSNVANGLNLSGAALKATNDYAQDRASKEYSAAYNRAFQKYTDDRNFDYNAWKAESQQYYNNLLNQLNGLNNTSQRGVEANKAKSNALSALANNNAAAIQQQATANGAADMANTSAWTSVLDSISKGLTMGTGLAASKAGATPGITNTTPMDSTNSYTAAGSLNNGGGEEFATLFMNGWNPALNMNQVTTQDLVGNPVGA